MGPHINHGIDIWTTTKNGAVLVAAYGELDLASETRFREVIKRHLDEGMVVKLDLSNITFIDSVGLGALVMVARMPGEVRLVATSQAVIRLLMLVDLIDLFEP